MNSENRNSIIKKASMILDRKRLKILKKLKFLKNHHFYLADGTALALQMGHRVSLDFDFYTKEEFNRDTLLEEFQKNFKDVRLFRESKDTLILDIDNIGVSLFRYPYSLIRPLIKTAEVNLLSVEDIAAMKIVAIIQRGTRRNFVDIYFLIKKFGIEKIFAFAQEKYKKLFNKYSALQALTYFVDADREKEEERTRPSVGPGWDEIKKELVQVINEFKRRNLR